MALLVVSAFTIGSLVLFERILTRSTIYGEVIDWLAARRQHSFLVMRIGLGMTLLLSWQADSLLVPELEISSAWIGWFQFALVLALIFPRATPFAGVGVMLLWLIAVADFGLFHMLDYTLFIGVAIYLVVSASTSEKIKGVGVPALYLGLGFSLIWVALEKLIYPQRSLEILEGNQHLALGIPTDTFLTLITFSELALGFLLIIGLLGRPLGLMISLVMFTTALTFGKTEVIGHTIIHASLIVFLLEGEGNFYTAPTNIHRKLGLRFAFASVNFVIVSVVLFSIYTVTSRLVHEGTPG